MQTCYYFLFLYLFAVGLTACKRDGAPPVVNTAVFDDTSSVNIQRRLDSVDRKVSVTVKMAKCKGVETSEFKLYGCCQDLCADSLELKPQDCCCEEALTAYEKMYQENYTTAKGRKKLAAITNDVIFVKCKHRYEERVRNIKLRYPPPGYNPYE